MALSLVSKAPGVAYWGWKKLPSNRPTAKAIDATFLQFNSRFPSLKIALMQWTDDDLFRGHFHSIQQGGQATDVSDAHVTRFVEITGISLGAPNELLLKQVLETFYLKLKNELGLPTVVATLEQIQANTSRQGKILHAFPIHTELDSPNNAIATEERQSKQKLDTVKILVEKREATAALTVLSDLEPEVMNGSISVNLRCRFHINRGICYLLLHKLDDAKLEFQTARTLEPKNAKALVNLAQAYMIQDRPEEAIKILNQAIEIEPDILLAHAFRLVCFHRTQQPDRIKAALSENASLLDAPDCLYALAFIESENDNCANAEAYLRKHNALVQDRPDAWDLLGRSILVPTQNELKATVVSPDWSLPPLLKGRLEEAESCFSKAEQLLVNRPNSEFVSSITNRGVARVLLHKYEDARHDLERALLFADKDKDEIHRNLGNLFQMLDQPHEAAKHYEAIHDAHLRQDILPRRLTASFAFW